MCALIRPGIGMVAAMLILNTVIDLTIFDVIITRLLIAGTSAIISGFGRIGSIINSLGVCRQYIWTLNVEVILYVADHQNIVADTLISDEVEAMRFDDCFRPASSNARFVAARE
jgi:hypothetical protein